MCKSVFVYYLCVASLCELTTSDYNFTRGFLNVVGFIFILFYTEISFKGLLFANFNTYIILCVVLLKYEYFCNLSFYRISLGIFTGKLCLMVTGEALFWWKISDNLFIEAYIKRLNKKTKYTLLFGRRNILAHIKVPNTPLLVFKGLYARSTINKC